MCFTMTRAMMCLHLLFLCGLMCAALPPAAFYPRAQTESGDRKHPSVHDVEDLKLIFDLTRSSRHADGLFTSGYSRLLSQLTAKDYLESLMDKRVNGDLTENQFPVKRHSDAIFTDSYSRFRNQMAARKYLNSMLQGKRSVDDVTLLEVSISPDATSSQTNEDSVFNDITNQLTLGL
ncbi:VIP peptides-like [Archocentrus centrarchus]|uniref:VIP peptides-like n=1 Tax=Archocentrus centrarchus TaxID=63155 RepID=UPI0011EA0205|nr:VIP peptides-like [Archocentrus centrarchus]